MVPDDTVHRGTAKREKLMKLADMVQFVWDHVNIPIELG